MTNLYLTALRKIFLKNVRADHQNNKIMLHMKSKFSFWWGATRYYSKQLQTTTSHLDPFL